MDSKVYII